MLEARTERGLVRPSNEDVAVAAQLPDGSRLLVVADGVGGYPGGEVASRTAVEAVEASFRADPAVDPEEGLRAAFAEANRQVREGQEADRSRMSTTLVAALARDAKAWIANVGDSRAYLVAGSGVQRLTLDHSWVEEEIRAGRLQPGDPAAELNRHVITRSIGSEEEVETDVYGPIALPDPSVLLLCSDGLHGVLEDAEIAEVVSRSKRNYVDDLVRAVLKGGAPDNVAIALLRHAPSAEGKR